MSDTAGREAYSKLIINRASRTIGHMSAIKRMMEEEREYQDVLMQLSAVRAEVIAISKQVIKDQLTQKLSETIDEKDEKLLQELHALLEKRP